MININRYHLKNGLGKERRKSDNQIAIVDMMRSHSRAAYVCSVSLVPIAKSQTHSKTLEAAEGG